MNMSLNARNVTTAALPSHGAACGMGGTADLLAVDLANAVAAHARDEPGLRQRGIS